MGRSFRVVSVGKTMLKLGLLTNIKENNKAPRKKIRNKTNLERR
jgi:hypothetical protein